jgi:hypothetical protein
MARLRGRAPIDQRVVDHILHAEVDRINGGGPGLPAAVQPRPESD